MKLQCFYSLYVVHKLHKFNALLLKDDKFWQLLKKTYFLLDICSNLASILIELINFIFSGCVCQMLLTNYLFNNQATIIYNILITVNKEKRKAH